MPAGATYSNYGVDAHGALGSGGATVFYNDSRAIGATFDNYGATLQGYTGAVPAPGRRTVFFDDAQASYGTFNNHPGQGMGSLGAGITDFSGNSNAGTSIAPFTATYNNLGGVPGAPLRRRDRVLRHRYGRPCHLLQPARRGRNAARRECRGMFAFMGAPPLQTQRFTIKSAEARFISMIHLRPATRTSSSRTLARQPSVGM